MQIKKPPGILGVPPRQREGQVDFCKGVKVNKYKRSKKKALKCEVGGTDGVLELKKSTGRRSPERWGTKDDLRGGAKKRR